MLSFQAQQLELERIAGAGLQTEEVRFTGISTKSSGLVPDDSCANYN